jgi:acyl-CoA synthetase (AMP-forming)/AMP-acid ligase II
MNDIIQGVKIVRLQSGEDIIASMIQDSESEMIMLDNPMHLIFKRTSQGTMMVMLPWLPIELIKDNTATIYTSDVLTIFEPKDALVEYYGNMINTEQLKQMRDNTMVENLKEALSDSEDENDGEEEDNEETLTKEEAMEIIHRRKSNRLH